MPISFVSWTKATAPPPNDYKSRFRSLLQEALDEGGLDVLSAALVEFALSRDFEQPLSAIQAEALNAVLRRAQARRHKN